MQASELCSEGLSIRVIENLLLPEGMDGGPSEGSRGREATGKSVHNMAVRVSLRAGRQWLVPSMSIFFAPSATLVVRWPRPIWSVSGSARSGIGGAREDACY